MSIKHFITTLSRFDTTHPALARGRGLPRLLILTDKTRNFDVQSQLERWTVHCAIIERTFGALPTPTVSGLARHQLRLATCTPIQARNAKLDGIHWPENRLKLRQRSTTNGLIETCSAHSGLAIGRAIQAGISTILVSTAFSSGSPSAGKPKGAVRLASLARTFPRANIYALGGINLKTAKRISRCRLSGVAIVSFAD